MSRALISVVIPAYNARKTIGDALESVRAQTYPAVETILVDDGSSDQTGEWVKAQFPWVRVFHVDNGGPSRARNYGIQQARGEWVAFLDSDDEWQANKLSAQIQVSQQDPSIGLVATDWLRQNRLPDVPSKLPVSKISYRDMLILNRFQTSTVMMKRSLLERLNGFDPSVDGAEDWDLWLRVSAECQIRKIDWPLVRYRDVETGYSKDVWRVYRTMQPMLDKHINRGGVSGREFHTIRTWHHLRFAVAFFLMHDWRRAWLAFSMAWRFPLYVPPATSRFLVPFLWNRMRRKKLG